MGCFQQQACTRVSTEQICPQCPLRVCTAVSTGRPQQRTTNVFSSLPCSLNKSLSPHPLLLSGGGCHFSAEPPAWDYSSRTPSDQSESPPRPSRSFGTPISNPNRETAGHNGAAFPSARKGTPARGRSPGQEGSETSRRRQDVMDKKKVRLLEFLVQPAARG